FTLLQMLNEARTHAGMPFYISSGCRCDDHNKATGGKVDSAHLTGKAADISAIHSRTRCKVLKALIETGFFRIGIGRTFIHVDIDYSKSREVIWLY
ncbi:MAG: D-Ala-D-Ala carboxypeptidase family metallohydrolase, partial [Candidatus Bathyarchaeota archaeon]|nr:D-Ala-D-Ala carboxypeptidase family metallohydrolase [Candidatus Bathyarchaeota archaeon]